MKILLTFLLLLTTSIVCAQKVDSLKLMADLNELSSDRFEGRKPGTYGSRLAQFFLTNRYKEIGLLNYNPEYQQGVIVVGDKLDAGGPDSLWNFKLTRGINIIGYIPGRRKEAIVISAHYDHVGIVDNQVYNGADDNASGVAALLSIATYFSKNQPEHTLIFAAFDAEEIFMRGSLGFVTKPPIPLNFIKLNINMDLIGTSTEKQMYIGGTRYNREFRPLLSEIWKRNRYVTMRFGYDDPKTSDDRTYRSDHFVFHQNKIPYLYFGVPEHPNYHKPTDDFENISHSFYYKSVELILESVIAVDKDFPVKE